jgi:hypothetical protein
MAEPCGAARVNFYRAWSHDNGVAEWVPVRKYHWLFVGTYRLTTKEHRGEDDFQFHKLSNGTMKSIPRGWSRHATREFDFCYESRMKSTASSAQCGKTKSRLLFSICIKCAAILKVKWYFDVKKAKGNVLSSMPTCSTRLCPPF